MAPFRGLYLPNAWSRTLMTSKRHTFRVSAFHQYNLFGVKLFPAGCAQDSRRYPKNAKKFWFWIWLRPRYIILKFFTIAPVLTSTLTVCHRNRRDPSTAERQIKNHIFWSIFNSLRKDSVVNYASIQTLFPPSVKGPDVLCNALNILHCHW